MNAGAVAVPSGAARAAVAGWFALLLALVAVLLALVPVQSRAQSVSLIRDAEIEALLEDYARPIFRAAGISSTSVEILLVPDGSFNAFVADGNRMFINTGAILGTETPNELIGIIAHETGHLAGNHLAHLRAVARNTRIATMLAAVLGMGAVAAGSSSISDLGNAGPAIMAGAQHIGTRSILSYVRAEEAAADRTAVTYLEATGQSPEGMLRTFQRMAGDNVLLFQSIDPYTVSHPLPAERLAQMEGLVAASRFRGRTDPADLQLRHDMVRAKLTAFMQTAQQVGRNYPNSDNSLPARYARAIVAYRFSPIDSAVRAIDDLIRSNPGNPYFHELKGQALLERGRARDALAPLRRAVELEPDSGLLKILLGHALVETGDAALLDEAVRHLTQGLRADPNVSTGYRYLGRAYAARGDVGMAQLVTAEGLLADGNVDEAKVQAGRAQGRFALGSPQWLRAEDILTFNPPSRR